MHQKKKSLKDNLAEVTVCAHTYNKEQASSMLLAFSSLPQNSELQNNCKFDEVDESHVCKLRHLC